MLKILGDVHAGKQFINDVPLHRRGEREAEVLAQLRDELLVSEEVTSHVQVGDLFDQFEVSNETLMSVYISYRVAAQQNPQCNYYLIPGNHDLSRDADKVSTFQILAAMLKAIPNIRFVKYPEVIDGMGFMPWSPFQTAEEIAKQLTECDMVFCHCDLEGGGPNVIPYDTLSKITKKVITGHVHTPQTFQRNGLEVVVTGSMQPYSHAEDPEHKRYLTVTVSEYNDLVLNYQDVLKNKYIRLILPKGMEVPTNIPNCMGFKTISEKQTIEPEQEKISLDIQDFNTRNLFQQCMEDCGVPKLKQETMLEKFDVSQAGN